MDQRTRDPLKAAGAFDPETVVLPLDAGEWQTLRRALRNPAKAGAKASELLCRFLLAEVVNNVLGSLSLDDLLERLAALAAATLGAERGTIFLYDTTLDELFSRVAQGSEIAEIRIPRESGIAGLVFQSGAPEIAHDAYAHPRFNPEIDRRTGFRTRSVICVPLGAPGGPVIGAMEVLNKREKRFDQADLALLQAIARQAATALTHAQAFEAQARERAHDKKLLEMTEAVSVEIDLDRLLMKIVGTCAELLDAERSTLFVHDPATGELWSRLTGGGGVDEMRFSSGLGIAGASFTTLATLNVADAYADSRFNAAIDTCTGYHTRNLLCVPIVNHRGSATAVVEVLNKRAGPFTALDERRLQAFATQIAIALQNAQLFTDVLALKNYSESILRSMSEGVVTLDPELRIKKVNEAARKLLGVPDGTMLKGAADRLWGSANPWLAESLAYVVRSGGTDHRSDVAFVMEGGFVANVNVTVAPLRDAAGGLSGIALILQDISQQKRVHATISRYMAREFAERVLTEDIDANAGASHVATMLFSDIRRFTTLAEALTPQATVEMLNEYFSEMAGIVQEHSGVLDKYIGDAVMAVFGAPVVTPADADNAVAAAIHMIRRLRELNLRRLARGAPPLEIGVGVATGDIVSGSVGSTERMNYTVIGDSVNLASRLESANKLYRTMVLLAATTVERLQAPIRLRRIDRIRVKGKDTPTEIFEALDYHPQDILAKLEEILPVYEDGVRRYLARDWSQALARFSDVIKVLPKDGPSWVYADRCLYYRDHPPPDHWDGVWTMATK